MNREGTDMSITELMESMKDSADEIIGKGEDLVKKTKPPVWKDNGEPIDYDENGELSEESIEELEREESRVFDSNERDYVQGFLK